MGLGVDAAMPQTGVGGLKAPKLPCCYVGIWVIVSSATYKFVARLHRSGQNRLAFVFWVVYSLPEAEVMVTPISNLDIHLFYRDPKGWRWSLCSLAQGAGYLDPDHMAPDAFFGIGGGVRVLADRIYCFLETEAAGEMVEYVNFLMASVVGLRNGSLPPPLKPFKYGSGEPGVLALVNGEDGSSLRLRESTDLLLLDYLGQAGDAPEKRGSPYFRAVGIERSAWCSAAIIALEEYFDVVDARERDAAAQGLPPSGNLRRFSDAWHALRR